MDSFFINHSDKKEQAFKALSIQAKLHIKLEEAKTDQEKFMWCVRYATDIAQMKSLNNHIDELTDTNFKVIMQLIKSYLDAGVHPDYSEDNKAAIFHAVTHPALVKLLLTKGANPNIRNVLQSTPLHWVAMFFHSYHKENLFITAELLAAAGADLYAKDSDEKKPIDHVQYTLLSTENEIREIESRFKQVTEHPRKMDNIPVPLIEASPYSSLQLTENDYAKINLYKENKYDDLIHMDFRNSLQQIINSYSSTNRILHRVNSNNAYTLSSNLYNFLLTDNTPSHQEQPWLLQIPRSQSPLFNAVTTILAEQQPQNLQMALNGAQKNIIEGTLKFIFDDIASTLTPSQAVKTLDIILSNELTENEVQTLKKKNVWDSVKQIRDILTHPFPQNRYQGDGNAYWHNVLKGRSPATPEESTACETGVDHGIVYYYKSGFGSKVLTEAQGILGLTSRNDDTAPPATKEAVVTYIHELIQKEIKQYQNKAASSIQMWYRRTHHANKPVAMAESKENSTSCNNMKKI